MPPLQAAARWARSYPLAPRYRPPATSLRLRSADGTSLAAVALPGPAAAVASVVVVHGFSNSSRTPEVQRLAHELATAAHVVVLDLRGHGRSRGRSTLGRREPDDVDAAVVAAAERAPGLPVVAVGVSLGGAASLVAAGRGSALAGVVAVSAPAWPDLTSPAGARLARWRARPSRRALVWAISGTRLDPAPDEAEPVTGFVGAIAPGFVVVAHDPGEAVFGPEHAQALYDAAGEPKELWWVPGGGHGRSLLTPAFGERVRDEITTRVAAAPGPCPPPPAPPPDRPARR
jgi:pimeloyl-ACP methyl ester carboxylesterase